jgi:hypothetical protein
VPQWVLDEAVGVPSKPDVWRAGPAVLGPPPRRTRWRTVLGAGVVVGVVVAAVLTGYRPSLFGAAAPAVAAPPSARTQPTPGLEEHRSPLGVPVTVTTPSDRHRWMRTGSSGEPVRWDPCRPVHLVVRPRGAPVGGEDVLAAAAAEVRRVTGLQLVVDGSTDETSLENRASFQPARYGDRWAPVLVAWVTPDENPDFAAGLAGQAGPQVAQGATGRPVFVSGQVELDAAWFATTLATPGRAPFARAVILHELAHLVGLEHVNDPAELMYADNVGLLAYGPGDLAGLAELGHGPCVPDV